MVMGGVRSTGAAQCRSFGLLQTPLFLCSYVLMFSPFFRNLFFLVPFFSLLST